MSEAKVNELQVAIQKAIDEGTIKTAPTLKAIAAALEVAPNRVYTVAKQPKEGEVYDAHVYNWDAIERFIGKRIADEMTFEEFVEKAIEKDVEFASQDRRTGKRTSDADKFIPYSEGLMPTRKFALEVGQRVLTKKDKENVYVIAMMTDTHVVLQLEDTPELKVFSNWTANSQLIPPTRFDETLEKRQKEAAEEAEAAEAEEADNSEDAE